MKKLSKTQVRYYLRTLEILAFTPQELSWVIAGLLGFKRVAMTGEPGFFEWPGNARVAQLAHHRPVVICDLQGNVHYECHSKSFLPQGSWAFDVLKDPHIFQALIEQFKISLRYDSYLKIWEATSEYSGLLYTGWYNNASKERAVVEAIIRSKPQKAYGFPAAMFEHRRL